MPCNFSVSSRNEGQRGLLLTGRNHWDIIAKCQLPSWFSPLYVQLYISVVQTIIMN